VARTFATFDLMCRGRAAWNVVTSLNDSEAANFGRDQHLEHDMRYDRADEFMEVVHGHWRTWADDALVMDKASGLFAEPAKVRRLNHQGKWFKSRGPFTVPPSPQGHPVIMQAGQSGRGRDFAARWGEVVFTTYSAMAAARQQYQAFKAEVAQHGRDPDLVHIVPAIYPIVGETRAMAEAKMELIDRTSRPVDGFVLLSEMVNFDFARKEAGDPLTDAEMQSISGMQTMRDKVVQGTGTKNPTPTQFLQYSKRGTIRENPILFGSPTEVADQMEEWFTGRACDGFVLCATHTPGAYEDFVRLVVPELQRRNLFHKDYAGSTLRENLGLPRPQVSHP
jgi:FMN-dependent oxidoreductase (nitrilotriacetate monooxygenase family)